MSNTALPECYGGVFQRVGAYATCQNDIWALGVILVNLTCGRNPWRQACANDDTFRAYVQDPDFLPTILPVSQACNDILKRIFTLNPQARITLPELRQAIRRVTRFTMTNEELRRAPEACKAAARAAWSEAQKAAKRHPIVVPSIIIEEYAPIKRIASATIREYSPLVVHDSVQYTSSSAGSEQTSRSLSRDEVPPLSTEGSNTSCNSIDSTGDNRLHSRSANSSGSTAADSSGPTTPEWNPNADNAAGLPDVANEPLALDADVVPQSDVPIVKAVRNMASPPVKEPPVGSMRGMKDLWRKVRF